MVAAAVGLQGSPAPAQLPVTPTTSIPPPAPLVLPPLAHGMATDRDERDREVRKWVARGHGRSTLEEVVSLLMLVG